jgi:hypothetical protein
VNQHHGTTLKWHLALSGLALAITAALFDASTLLGVLAGSGLGILSLASFVIVGRKLAKMKGVQSPLKLGLFLALKYPILFGATYLIMIELALEPLPVCLGFGIFPIALILGGLNTAGQQAPVIGGAGNEQTD